MCLSIEAIIAIIGVVVGLPPTVLVLGRYMKRRGSRRREETRGIIVSARDILRYAPTPIQVAVKVPDPLIVLDEALSYAPRQLRPPPPHHAFRRDFFTTNVEPPCGLVNEQYSLRQTVTITRSYPCHPP
ncbi:hypothetical protein F5B17DRAFT_447674 [Nemania serpens]|nr:hypothetical protein F5B17DRAFT_447674 [Nemania serpens]